MAEDRRRRDGRRSSREHSRERRRRSPTPPAARPAAQAASRTIAWTRDNMELLFATFSDVLKLVEVQRLLNAHNRATPAILRGDVTPLSVLKGLLVPFKYQNHHLGTCIKYAALDDGEDYVEVESGLDSVHPLIPVLSISQRNLLADPDYWKECGQEELRRVSQAYLCRHGRGLPIDEAAAAAWRRKAALGWFRRYRQDEQGLAPHLDRLIDDFRDRTELASMARRFMLSPPEVAPEREQRQREGRRSQEQEALQQQQQQQQRERNRSGERERGRSQPAEQQGKRSCSQPAEQQGHRDQDQREREERRRRDDAQPCGRQERRRSEEPRPQRQQQDAASKARKDAPQQLGKASGQQDSVPNATTPRSGAAAASGTPPAVVAAAVAAAGTQDACELPPHLAGHQHQQQEPNQQQQPQKQKQQVQSRQQKQQGQGPPSAQLARPQVMAAQEVAHLPGSDLPLPPHLVSAAAAPAPAFIPLGAATPPVTHPADAVQQQAQEEQQPAHAAAAAAGGNDELLAARRAAVAAARSGRDPRSGPSSGGSKPVGTPQLSTDTADAADREGMAVASAATMVTAVSALAPKAGTSVTVPAAAAAAAAGDKDASAAGGSAAAGSKRKRAAIQWRPSEAQPGDAPLQLEEALAAKAAAAAKAGAVAKAAASARESGPKAKQQKVEKAGASPEPAPKGSKQLGKADKAAASSSRPPKSFTITVRNNPPTREASPAVSEEGELRPAKAARVDKGKGGAGMSRLAAGSSNPHLPVPGSPLTGPSASATTAWQQQQQQQQQQHARQQAYDAGSAGGLAFAVRAATPTDETPAFPPGFANNSSELSAGMRAVDTSAGGGGGGGALRVRVMGQPSGEYGSAAGTPQQQQQTLPNAAAYMAGTGASLQHFSAAEGAALAQQLAAHGYGAALAQGGPFVDSQGTTRYDFMAAAAAALVPSPADIYLSVALQQQQQQQLQQLQQARVSYAHSDLPSGFDGSGAAYAAAYGAAPPSPLGMPGGPEPQASASEGRRSRGSKQGAANGRRVELESSGSGKAAQGGGSGRQGRAANGAAGGGGSSDDACWDPSVCWEEQLLALLQERPDGISLGDLHKRLPLPPCMPRDLDVLVDYLILRKQLCSLSKSQHGRQHSVVHAAQGSDAWLRFKRSLLQLLANRRPRLEAGLVQRQLRMPASLPDRLQGEAERDFSAFVSKYLRDEVALVKGSKGQVLLELRPFRPAAGGPGVPRINPPFPQPCTHFIKGRCSYGDTCYHSHAPARPYGS